MIKDYWIYDWAKLRQDEVIRIPQEYIIHSDFTVRADKNEIIEAFAQINLFFSNMYGDIAEHPEQFGMPLHQKDKYRFFSQQWRDSGQAPYRPAMLLYNLFICGDIFDQAVVVSLTKLKSINKVKQSHCIFSKLTEYGFVFEGLKNNKLFENDIIISYPDNTVLLLLLKALADKAHNTNRLDDFFCCHFRLLQDNMNTANYGQGADDVADRIHTEAEKEFVYKMDEALLDKGMFRKLYGGYEGHGFAYYDSENVMKKKGPYLFRLVSRSPDIVDSIHETEKMLLMVRIRNVSNCLEYLATCPDSVKEVFRYNDPGCANRPCNKGIAYEFEGKNYWRCGCCAPAFRFKPNVEDIPHYIKLVDLGSHK